MLNCENDERFMVFYKHAHAIAKVQYSGLEDQLIDDMIVGGLINIMGGKPASSLMLAAAYDAGISPNPDAIIRWMYYPRQRIMEEEKIKRGITKKKETIGEWDGA